MEYSSLFNNLKQFMVFLKIPYFFNESISTKLTVNLALYYKTIDNLGTGRHQRWKMNVETGEDVGCFGLTELGHGSNVLGLGTTAHYDKKTKEFVLNTPDDKSMKFWIGGAAYTATTAAIFAQLYIDGESKGPHAFLVKIRDMVTKKPEPGVVLGDCGKKIGLDGIDNGFIILQNVRIPRENLLNKFSDVTEAGEFTSTVKNIPERLSMSLGALS